MRVRKHPALSLQPIVIAVALSVVAGCRDPIVAEKSVVISGDVIDARSHLPLDSAWVASIDSLAPGGLEYSDSLGRFAVSADVAWSFLVLYAGKDGYNTGVDTIQLGGHNISGVRMELTPGAE